MEEINLSARPREEFGKCPSRRLRRDGRVPAILYGSSIPKAVALSLDGKLLEKVLHTGAGENVLVNLSLEGGNGATEERKVMFKDITRHPLMESIQHVDLLEVVMDKKIAVEVPIHIAGKAEGVAMGGILQQETRKVRIECLPGKIPDSLDADVTPLAIGNALHVSDLKLPEGVEVLDDPALTVVSVVAPVTEEEAKTAEEVEAELAESFEEKEEGAEGAEEKEAEKEKEKE
jgi:large subunit ribosomal protein L25